MRHFCILVFGQLKNMYTSFYMDNQIRYIILNARLCPQTGQSHLIDQVARRSGPMGCLKRQVKCSRLKGRLKHGGKIKWDVLNGMLDMAG